MLFFVPGHDRRDPSAVIRVWYVKIEPKQTKLLLDDIRKKIPEDPTDLSHLRRVWSSTEGNNPPEYLKVMVCSEFCLSRNEVESFLGLEVGESLAARYPSYSQEEAVKASEKGWPVMWRGHRPHDTGELSDEEHDLLEKWASRLTTHLTEPEGTGCSSFTIIVDSKTEELIAQAEDHTQEHPLAHSIMNAITLAAESNKRRPGSYLLYNADVYTTAEPCAMCGMALVHSRIGRLVFVSPRPQGSLRKESELGYALQDAGLNHKYRVWRYHPTSRAPKQPTQDNSLSSTFSRLRGWTI